MHNMCSRIIAPVVVLSQHIRNDKGCRACVSIRVDAASRAARTLTNGNTMLTKIRGARHYGNHSTRIVLDPPIYDTPRLRDDPVQSLNKGTQLDLWSERGHAINAT